MNKSIQSSADLQKVVCSIIKNYKIAGSTRLKKEIADIYNKNKEQSAIEDKIYQEIYVYYRIDREMIHHSKQRGVVTNAKVMAILLFHKHIDISQAEIAKRFSRGQSIISRRVRSFYSVISNGQDAKIIDKVYCDPAFISIFNHIDKKIKKFKDGRK